MLWQAVPDSSVNMVFQFISESNSFIGEVEKAGTESFLLSSLVMSFLQDASDVQEKDGHVLDHEHWLLKIQEFCNPVVKSLVR